MDSIILLCPDHQDPSLMPNWLAVCDVKTGQVHYASWAVHGVTKLPTAYFACQHTVTLNERDVVYLGVSALAGGDGFPCYMGCSPCYSRELVLRQMQNQGLMAEDYLDRVIKALEQHRGRVSGIEVYKPMDGFRQLVISTRRPAAAVPA